jgi:hypothetical protein
MSKNDYEMFGKMVVQHLTRLSSHPKCPPFFEPHKYDLIQCMRAIKLDAENLGLTTEDY